MRKTIYDIRCGWHSRVPVCCILYYLTFWRLFSAISVALFGDRRLLIWYTEGVCRRRAPRRKTRFGRAACPICLCLRRDVTLAACACSWDVSTGRGTHTPTFEGMACN